MHSLGKMIIRQFFLASTRFDLARFCVLFRVCASENCEIYVSSVCARDCNGMRNFASHFAHHYTVRGHSVNKKKKSDALAADAKWFLETIFNFVCGAKTVNG